MRFVTYQEQDRVGLVDGDSVLGLAPRVSLVDLIGAGPEALTAAGDAARRDPRSVLALSDAVLRSPIPHPPTIRHFMTFESHLEGTVKLAGPDASIPDQWYRAPAFYFSNPYATRGPFDDVEIPPGCALFDYELEVAAVIGRPGRDITPENAETHIAGYLLMNDWSARDIQFAEMQVHLGPAKGKDTATSLGPYLVAPDELEPYRHGNAFDLQMTARVNGEVTGSDRWSNMNFSYAQMIAYASRGTEIRTGDVLGSGTCGGGCLAELWGRNGLESIPPLKPGDTVSIDVEGLGAQNTRVVEQRSPGLDPEVLAARRRG